MTRTISTLIFALLASLLQQSDDEARTLDGLAHADAGHTLFAYDDNGNTTRKTHRPVTRVLLYYQNESGQPVQAHLTVNGVDQGAVTFAAGGMNAVSLAPNAGTYTLTVSEEDAAANAGASVTLLNMVVTKGNWSQVYPISGGSGAEFGGAAGDAAAYAVALPGEDAGNDVTDYAWDATNRLTSATLSVWGGMGKTATFEYAPATLGWQVASQTVDGETRTFSWGYGGELLSETIPNVGTRSYVNAGLDQVLWSVEGASANSWLNDVNGSVYGITDQTGSIIQRQRYDAYGATEVTQENAGFANRVGFQGRNEIAGFGIQNFRNRFYDPSVGRFLSRDPLGLVDGPAVYAFCGGEPVNRTDPMGTFWEFIVGSDEGNFGELQYRWNNESAWGRAQAEPEGGPGAADIEAANRYFTAGGEGVFQAIHYRMTGAYARLNDIGDPHMAGMTPFPLVTLGGNLFVPKAYKTIRGGMLDVSPENLESGGLAAHYLDRYDRMVGAFGLYGMGVGAKGNSAAAINLIGGQWGYDIQTAAFAQGMAQYATTTEGQKAGIKIGILSFLTYKVLKSRYARVIGKFAEDMAERFGRTAAGEFVSDALATANGAPMAAMSRGAPASMAEQIEDAGLRIKSAADQGRDWRIERLELLEFERNTPSHVKGWIRNERRRVERLAKKGISATPRMPPGYELGHPPGKPARAGYDYSNADLQGVDLNDLDEAIRRKLRLE
jgi:RHS repeat-associated protein